MKTTAWMTSRTALALIAIAIFSALAHAEPIEPNPVVNKPHTAADDGAAASTAPLQPMDVSQPAALKNDVGAYFYKYNASLALMAGPYDQPNLSDGMQGLLGVDYSFESLTMFHWEAGIETITTGEGHVWLAARWNYRQTARFRPYWNFGLGARVNPANQLATFLQLKDYFPRVAYGAEYSINEALSLCGELAAAVDFQGGFFGTLTLGVAFGL